MGSACRFGFGLAVALPAEPVIDVMRAIKRAWDPNNILNPGKIFDI